jgi:hypothetical protein
MDGQGPKQVREDATFEPQPSSTPPVVEQSEFEFDVTLSTVVKIDARPHTTQQRPQGPLSPDMLDRMNRYWMAANFLTVGQIYLFDNPLLKRSLTAEDIKPRFRTPDLGDFSLRPFYRSNEDSCPGTLFRTR